MFKPLSRTNRRRLSASVIALTTVGFIGVACSTGQNDASGPGKTGPDGQSTLRVTTIELCTELSLYWARDKGIFEKHNLDVEVVRSTGGAAALAALQGNSVDVAYTSAFPALIAASNGVELSWIASGTYTSRSAEEATQTVSVREDSDIRRGRDLEGKTIAVNEIGGVTHIMMQQFIAKDGGDPSRAKFVALPFGQMGGAVAQGTVDAGQIPSDLAAATPGLRSIGEPYYLAANGKKFIATGYAARAKDADTPAMESFFKALDEAVKDMDGDEKKQERIKLQTSVCSTPANILEIVPEPPYDAVTSVSAMSAMQDLLLANKIIQKPVDVKRLIADYAEGS